MDNWTESITWLFVAANSGRIVAYVPQLVAAWRCENGARSISRMTWGYFASAHLTGVLYATYVIHDERMALVFSGNLLTCTALVGIVSWKKLMHARQLDAARPVPRPDPWRQISVCTRK